MAVLAHRLTSVSLPVSDRAPQRPCRPSERLDPGVKKAAGLPSRRRGPLPVQESDASASALVSRTSVSYTHLDVYKRQVHALLGRWPSIVGEAVAQHSTPESFVAGIVTIRTDSTAWASQLRLMTPQLLAKLNAAVGEGTIKRLTIKGPDAPSWKHGIRSVRDGRGPRDTYG